MTLYNLSVDISPTEGFEKNDIFGYEPFGKRLADILEKAQYPLTMAIDAQWGEGKTTFLKMWPGYPINKKPLIFIIDELDRCKPDYALKILERIKHFFSVENIHFIFGVHMTQLENSVTSKY